MISENKLIDWVNSIGGVCVTRKTVNKIDFSSIDYAPFFCLTGYSNIINSFFTNCIDKLRKSVVLIIIETDIVEIKKEWLENEKLIHCFTWNKPFEHKKMSCLPIGINHYRHFEELSNWLKNRINREENDKRLLCMNCSLHTNKVRRELYEKMQNLDFCTQIEPVENKKSYFEKSNIEGQIKIDVVNPECYNIWSKYKFILSPPGTGFDCHRTWEAIYIGCIPIVISSTLNELYEDLPVLVVESWDEITEDYLNEQYQLIKSKKYDLERLNLDYWTKKIEEKVKLKTKPKIHFITYANNVFEDAKKRILKEALDFGEFDTVKGYSPEDLPIDFKDKFADILKIPRIAGCGLWRPKIILEKLKEMNNGEYLLYLDAGCKLNAKGKKRFFEYINMLDNSNKGIITIRMSGNNGPGSLCKEKEYSRREIFEYFNVKQNSEIRENPQCLSGVLLMKKNEHLMEIILKWMQAVYDNPLMFTDIYNDRNQDKSFIANRHEQSVLSILTQIYGSINIDGDESWIQPLGCGESLNYPFWATRSKK